MQSMQPEAPRAARHWTQAVPALPTQTVPQAASATAQAAALNTLQPDGSTPAPAILTPVLRWTGGL
jgi:hypothetical protein